MNDDIIIGRFLAGDPESIELVRGWIRAAFVPYRAKLAPDLEDLEQEILLDLTRILREGRYRGQSRLRTFVSSCGHHKCIDRLRTLGRRQWIALEDLDLPSRALSALDKISKSEAAELALRVQEQMPESCRQLWRMLEKGMRYREMSRRLGIAEGTLRARVLRCRRRALAVRQQLLAAARGNETRTSTTK